MKITLYGKNAGLLIPLLDQLYFTVNNASPDLVISYGGDGTLLAAEQAYPGIPKLPLRDSSICIKCARHSDEIMLRALAQHKLKPSKYQKLQAQIHNQTILALNDIVVRNSLPMHAIRFQVLINNTPLTDHVIIGDGLVASTAFGSTGYFHSITRQTFAKDFGLAFNNTTQHLKPVLFTGTEVIAVTIIRGPSGLSVDNHPKILPLKEHDTITINAAADQAVIYTLDTLRCPNCIVARNRRIE